MTRISQRDLAGRLGINPAAVNRWLTGKTEPVRISYERIASVIGVPLDMIAPVVARRVPSAPTPGNFSIPIQSAVDLGKPIAAGAPTVELPEWLVYDWFGGRPSDERACAHRLLDDSLSPLVPLGSLLVLDCYATSNGWPAAELRGGLVYAVRSRAGAPCVLRKLSFDGRSIICEPVNPDRKRYPATVISAESAKVPSIVPAVVVGRIERFTA